MEELKKTMQPSDIDENLDDNTKFVAFHFMHDKNLTAIKKTIEIFQLVESKKLFVNYIRRLIDRREFKTAGSIACELQLFRDFGVDDLLIPLFLTDKIIILESYLKNNAAHLQVEFVMFLDSLQTPESSVDEKCEELLKKYFITESNRMKLNEKPVNKLIERLVSLYKLDADKVAPLHSRWKLSKKLGFAVRNHYQDKKSSPEAFQDQLNHLHIEDDEDLQVELLERLMVHCKFKDAEKFAEKLKVPRGKIPADLNEYIENGTTRKRPRISENSDCEINVENVGGWNDEFKLVEDELYELKLSPLMVDSAESYSQMIEELKAVKRIAFDIEHTTSGLVAILQISTSDKVFIIDILELGKFLDKESWKKLGCDIFNNPDIVKLGFGILPDIQMLQKIPEMSIETPLNKSYRDLKFIGLDVLKLLDFKYPYHEEKLTNLSLTKLTKICFGKKLDKRNQLSNWSLRPLRPDQMTYAAIDAFVLIEIHDVILGILKNLKIAEDEMEKFFFE